MYDTWVDVVRDGDPVLPAVAEHAVFVALALALVVGGVALLRADRFSGAAWEAGKWTAAATAVAVVAFGWMLFVQRYLQRTYDPFALAGKAVVVAALGGFGVGLYAVRVREARTDLRQERERFRTLFENVPIAAVAVEETGGERVVEAANPAFEDVFGYDRSAVEGESVESVLAPPDRETTVLGESPDGGERIADGFGREVRLETEDGLRDFLSVTAPVEDGGDRGGTYAMYIEVTERKQRKQRLEVLKRVLRHNVRNQVTVIEGHASMLEEELDPGMETSMAATIEDVATDLTELSEQTRAAEQLVAGDTTTEPTEITEVVERNVAALASEFPLVRFVTDLPESTYVSATAALSVAVKEAVENAAKHNDREDGSVSVVVDSHAEYTDLVITDDGPGIPGSEWESVVGETERTPVEHATGIGLWTVAWVVRDCGGTITVEENEPRGSVVTLRFPTADPPGA